MRTRRFKISQNNYNTININYLQGFYETNLCENLSHNFSFVYNRIFETSWQIKSL